MHYSKILPLVFLAFKSGIAAQAGLFASIFPLPSLMLVSDFWRDSFSNPKGKRCLLAKKNLICLLRSRPPFLLYMWRQQQQKSKLRHKLTSYVSRLRIRTHSIWKSTKKVSNTYSSFQSNDISRHFVFVLICQSSTHSTADFYQNSSRFVNKTRNLSLAML